MSIKMVYDDHHLITLHITNNYPRMRYGVGMSACEKCS